MVRLLYIALILAGVGAGELIRAGASGPRRAAPKALLLRGIDSLGMAAEKLERTLLAHPKAHASDAAVVADFLATRMAYKRIELFAEHFMPGTADAINGPPLEEVEEGDPNQTIIPPSGLQVLEELLFAPEPPARDEVLRHVTFLTRAVRSLRRYAEATTFSDENVFDAMRLEVARIATLGLAGFDAPLARSSMPESAAALEAIAEVARSYSELAVEETREAKELDTLLLAAAGELRASRFEDMDRLAFIVNRIRPISAAIVSMRNRLGIAAPDDRRLLRTTAHSPFERGAFDAGAAAPPGTGIATVAQQELGRMLFFDPVLSGDGTRSCASCHEADRAFTDGEPTSVAFDFNGRVRRNAPTLVNAALQRGLFYDMRVTFLEDQVAEVVDNPAEMHGSLDAAARQLSASEEYLRLAREAYPASATIDASVLRRSLAAFMRSLERLDAPFDRAVRGDPRAIDPAARRGFTVFMGKARCGGCHFAPLFNGTVPPAYERSEIEILGVTERFDTLSPTLDDDPGRGPVVRIDIHRNAFKTPTLRNVALTGPYMHNGGMATLEEVVEFYDRGGGRGMGVAMDRQTLASDRLELTAGEKSDLIAFMHALTDTTGLARKPTSLPAIAGGRGSSRRVGGDY